MTMNLVMAATMYPVLLLLFFFAFHQSKPKGGLLFGARLMEEKAREPEVQALRQQFRREMIWGLVLMALVPLLFFLVPYASIQLFLWVLWVFVAILLLELPYVRANRRLRQWKLRAGLVSDRERTIYAELSPLPRTVTWRTCLPQMVLSLAGAVLAAVLLRGQGMGEMVASVLTFGLMTVLFAFCAVWMDRLRMKVISSDSDVNLNYNRARRSLWKACWQGCAWINTAFTLVMPIAFWLESESRSLGLIIAATVVYILVLVVLIGRLLAGENRLNKVYRDKMDLAAHVDDDEHWLWGMMYYNPGDRRLNVEKRNGGGVTINVAHPAGKVITILVAVVLAASLVLCAWPIALEFTPMTLSVEGDRLVASQLREDYVLPLEEVEQVALLEGHPEWSRMNGSSLPGMLKGTFRIRETGERVEVFLDPENTYCIRLVAGGRAYYLSCAEDADTLAVYQQLDP